MALGLGCANTAFGTIGSATDGSIKLADAAVTDTFTVTDNQTPDTPTLEDHFDAGNRVDNDVPADIPDTSTPLLSVPCNGSTEHIGQRFIPLDRRIPRRVIITCLEEQASGNSTSDSTHQAGAMLNLPNEDGSCNRGETLINYITDYGMRAVPETDRRCINLSTLTPENSPAIRLFNTMQDRPIPQQSAMGECPVSDTDLHEVVQYSTNPDEATDRPAVRRSLFCIPYGHSLPSPRITEATTCSAPLVSFLV